MCFFWAVLGVLVGYGLTALLGCAWYVMRAMKCFGDN